MAELIFTIDDVKAKKMFSKALSLVTDLREPLKEAESYQLKQIDQQFRSEGVNILEKKWKSLKSKTIQQRLRSGFRAGPILTRTGKLRKSIKRKSLSKDKLVIHSTVSYYPPHQTGTKKIPQRQILGFSTKNKKKILDIISNSIIKKVQNG